MIVCDGFIGNVALKVSEGLVDMVKQMLQESLEATITRQDGYVLSRTAFTDFKKRVDYSEFGGAPLLGVQGVCIICHGRSNANAIKNAIRVAADSPSGNINRRIEDELQGVVAQAARSEVPTYRRHTSGGAEHALTAMRRLDLLACWQPAHSRKNTRCMDSLTLDPPSAAPGGTAFSGRLEARIDPGWHLYSASTPAGDPDFLPRRARESGGGADPSCSSPLRNARSTRTSTPILETFEGEVVFLVELQLKKDAPPGRPRSPSSPATRPATIRIASRRAQERHRELTVDPPPPPPRSADSGRLHRSQPPRRARRPARRTGGQDQGIWRAFLAGRVRLRAGVHLHALRVPDDPDHDVVLPEPAVGHRGARA